MKRICAITMVRNDDFYLRRWTAYYGAQLGEEHLYIFLDGRDQPLPDWCPKAHVEAVDKLPGKVVELEKHRLRFLSDRAAVLLRDYDLVIGVDADEFIVVDPALGLSLPQYLSSVPVGTSLSPLGVDVGQRIGEEGDIREDRPLLGQRQYAQLSTRYTKTSVIARPVQWGRGFHRIRHHDFHIAKDLYLFHFGSFDLARLERRFEGRTVSRRHLRKRTRTIRYCTRYRARDWDRTVDRARRLQRIFRPPYAWNKPGMLGLRLIVRIPERFRGLV